MCYTHKASLNPGCVRDDQSIGRMFTFQLHDLLSVRLLIAYTKIKN
jgi:hypothetical protein